MKKILIFTSILIVLLVGGAIFYFNWRHNFLRRDLPQLVFLKSDSLYSISYGDVYIDELNGEIIIEKLLLRPDSTHTTEPGEGLPRTMLEVYVPRMHMTGLHTDKAMMNEEVIARKLELTQPIVTLYRNKNKEQAESTSGVVSSHDIYKAILRNLLRIKIDSLLIDRGRYHMVNWRSRDTILTCSSVTVSLFDLNISDSTSRDTSRVLFAKKALLSVDKLKIPNDAGLYNYRISSVELNSEQRVLTAKTLAIDPTLGEAEFARKLGRQGDRFDINFSNARFTNIDVNQVLDGNLVAGNLTIKEGTIKIYRDKNYPRNNVNKIGRFPQQLLMKSGTAISLGRIDINSGFIEYKEKSNLTGNTGKIRFNNSVISISNFSNRVKDLQANPVCLVNLRAQFLDVIPLNINLHLYPVHEQGKFTATGNLGSASALVLNQLLKPLGLANIESGQLNGCSFHIDGNNYGSNGTVRLLYNNLKVKLLAKDGTTGEYKSKKFASMLANAALKDENPKKNKPVRVAQFSYKRNPYKGFFNLVWKSIFTGVQQTVGIEAKEEVAMAKTDNR